MIYRSVGCVVMCLNSFIYVCVCLGSLPSTTVSYVDLICGFLPHYYHELYTITYLLRSTAAGCKMHTMFAHKTTRTHTQGTCAQTTHLILATCMKTACISYMHQTVRRNRVQGVVCGGETKLYKV